MTTPIRGLSLLLAFAPALFAAEEPQVSVTQRVDVTVRTVTAEFVQESGRPMGEPPDPAQIQVRQDGRLCEVVGVEPLRVAAPRAAGEAPGAAPQAAAAPEVRKPRRQVVYVDTGFLRLPSVKDVAKALDARVVEMLALGPVEVVVADPSPKTVLPATRDAAAVRGALAEVARKFPGRDRVLAVRRDMAWSRETVSAIDAARGGGRRGAAGVLPTGSGMARSAAREEEMVVRSGMDRLARWATESPVVKDGVLYLASDGFDIDLASFYSSADADTLRSQVVPDVIADVRRAEQALLAGGWTVVSVALGATGYGGTTNAAEFSRGGHETVGGAGPALTFADHPLDPLRAFAEATGGDVVVSADQVAPALERLASAWLVSFRVAGVPDGRLHRLEIRSLVPGVRVRSVRAIPMGTPEASSTSRVLSVLDGSEAPAGAKLALKDEKTEKGKRTAMLDVSMPLADAAPLLARVGPGRVRVSVAVEIPGSVPFVTHAELPLPRPPGPGFRYEAPISWPKEAKAVAVAMEELATGTVATARLALR